MSKDYKKLYEESIERARDLHDNHALGKPFIYETCEKIFPELRESEDERIRKGLIKGLSAMRDIHKHQTFSDDAINIDDAIAWLEKQGEQKTEIEYIYPKFRIGDVIVQIHPNGNSQPVRVLSISKKNQSYCCESDDHNVYSSIPIRCENEYKLVEQKSAWSEEDEEMIRSIRCYLNEFGNWLSDKNEEKSQSIYKACDWLKSIKPHWKPSEEQMNALEYFLKLFGKSDEQIEYTKVFQLVKELLNDLKKSLI